MKSRAILFSLSALFVLALAACDGEDAEPAAEADTEGGSVTVDVAMQDMEFVPDQVEVPAGADVTFNLTNDGAMDHDLVFEDGTASEMLAADETATLAAGPFTEDTVGWCDVPGHRESGMELEIIVVD